MKTGRPPKDNDLKRLQSTARDRKYQKRRVIVTKDVKFGIPRGLSEAVRIKVRKAAKYLYDNNLSKDCDRAAFRRYCNHLFLEHRAFEALKKEGDYIFNSRGDKVKHPAHQIQRDHSSMALKLEEHFHLTPLSRGKAKGEEPKQKKSALEVFQAKGKKLEVAQ